MIGHVLGAFLDWEGKGDEDGTIPQIGIIWSTREKNSPEFKNLCL